MNIEIDGNYVFSEKDFHVQLAKKLGVEKFYGFNLDALWDLLSAGVERPLILVWKDSEKSRVQMGDVFFKIIEILKRVELQDQKFGWTDKFSYILK
jgi:ribonuclease inhibitor